MKEFVDYTNVQEVIDDQNRPILELVPKMEKQIDKQNKLIAGMEIRQTRQDEKMNILDIKFKDFRGLENGLEKLEKRLN